MQMRRWINEAGGPALTGLVVAAFTAMLVIALTILVRASVSDEPIEWFYPEFVDAEIDAKRAQSAVKGFERIERVIASQGAYIAEPPESVEPIAVPEVAPAPPSIPQAAPPVQMTQASSQRLSARRFDFKQPPLMLFSDNIQRAILTNDLEELEPARDLGSKVAINESEALRLYWFNDIKDMDGQEVFQSWYYNGLLMSRVLVDVQSAQWRASTYKTVFPHQQGEWIVHTETLDEQPLARLKFTVTLTSMQATGAERALDHATNQAGMLYEQESLAQAP